MQDTESGEVEVDVEHLESEADDVLELKEKVRKLEADLIAQDHRAVPVLQAFFRDRRTWDRSDPRWKASWTAFIWWCVGGLATPAGAAVGLAAFLTLALTGWNAWEFRRQNEALTEQNETLRRQVDQQEADTLIVRRAQLLAIIYEEDCTGGAEEKACVPRSHLRARQEAALAFVEIERGRGVRANLMDANLQGANLYRANLEGANLFGANLTGANLEDAYLVGVRLLEANLYSANLHGANLQGANLYRANLFGANLGDVYLMDAYLTGANLEGAYLEGAYLWGARNLTQDQINEAIGNSKIKLPDGLTRPEHWKDEPKPEDP